MRIASLIFVALLMVGCQTTSGEAPRVSSGSDWPQISSDATFDWCVNDCLEKGGPNLKFCNQLCSCAVRTMHRIPVAKLRAANFKLNIAIANENLDAPENAKLVNAFEAIGKSCSPKQ